MLARGLIDLVNDICMRILHVSVIHHNSVHFETNLLVIGLFLIAFTAVLWYGINKLIYS